jgi:hypothetical protein
MESGSGCGGVGSGGGSSGIDSSWGNRGKGRCRRSSKVVELAFEA